ncbi:MAG: tRNA (N6-isopentenyl adenosine(37)-C2)-methylthiotransferase MiaB [Lachnospiraceae bacterium]|nr:tRNA (N6-isopentenyl adenosine(37)-C2)-methylthiotransferase MiaB [Lachnospiraceae bacterium]
MFNEIDIDSIDLSLPAPEEEPNRQYYYMKLLKKLVKEKYYDKGKTPLVYNLVVGCQMNAKDSEKILGILLQCGFVETDAEDGADLVVYNTCTIRENANLKVYGRLGYLNSLKRVNPDMLIAMAGCMMQEKHVVDTIKKKYRFVDVVFGTHNIYKVAELLCERLTTGNMVIDILEDTKQIVENLPAQLKFPFKCGVNIMYGCNNFCTFCIVPYVRGREKSRNVDDIIKEIEMHVADGVVEVMLLGQNVNSYGNDLKENHISFADLIRRVNEIEGLKRIRFMTSHPKDLSDDLIQAMKECDKVCKYLHLPLQSGSSAMLKRMNRHYTKEQYLTLVDKLRAAMPDITLSTDIIVGFPGETEEDFLETMDVVEKVRYDSAFTFIYSKRTGTPAASFEDQVPMRIVKDRFDRLLNRIQTIAAEKTGVLVGRCEEVLVEELNDHIDGYVTGRLDNNTLVHFPGTADLIGKIVNVKLNEAKGFYYLGECVK